MSIFRSIEYRAGVLVQYTLDSVWYAVQFALLRTAYVYVPQVAGYELREAYIFLAVLYTTDAFNMFFFEGGINHFTSAIRSGTLDFYLLKPMSTLFQLSVSRINLSGVFNIVFTLGFWIFTLREFNLNFDVTRWCCAILLFANGMLLNSFMRFIIASAGFWTTEGGTLNWLFHEMMRFGNKPESIYSGRARQILSSFIPVLLVSGWPAMALIRGQGMSFDEMIGPFAVTAVAAIVLKIVWWRGLRRYEGLSFQ
jgi:ABC-2 type transport system permease protein